MRQTNDECPHRKAAIFMPVLNAHTTQPERQFQTLSDNQTGTLFEASEVFYNASVK